MFLVFTNKENRIPSILRFEPKDVARLGSLKGKDSIL